MAPLALVTKSIKKLTYMINQSLVKKLYDKVNKYNFQAEWMDESKVKKYKFKIIYRLGDGIL
jgi:hypothetical protein